MHFLPLLTNDIEYVYAIALGIDGKRINIASCPSLVLQDSGSVSKLHPWNSDCSVGLRGIGLLSLWLYVSSLDSQRGFYLPTEKVTNSMGVPL